MSRVLAQARMELVLTMRRGESVLVAIGIPVGILAFFTLVDVLPHPGRAVDFLVPGVLALSVISSAMTSLSIATGFERHAGVLRRLAVTPLARSGLLAAKLVALVAVVALQVIVVGVVAVLLGWRVPPGGVVAGIAIALLGTAAFAGIGFVLAGRLRAETNLAVANALFLTFLLFGGIVVGLDRLPDGIAAIARLLPAEALATSLRWALGGPGAEPILRPILTLVIWTAAACGLAVRSFRFE